MKRSLVGYTTEWSAKELTPLEAYQCRWNTHSAVVSEAFDGHKAWSNPCGGTEGGRDPSRLATVSPGKYARGRYTQTDRKPCQNLLIRRYPLIIFQSHAVPITSVTRFRHETFDQNHYETRWISGKMEANFCDGCPYRELFRQGTTATLHLRL